MHTFHFGFISSDDFVGFGTNLRRIKIWHITLTTRNRERYSSLRIEARRADENRIVQIPAALETLLTSEKQRPNSDLEVTE